MHGVARAVGDYVSQDLLSQQCQIANQVEYFVAHEFIGVTERSPDTSSTAAPATGALL